VLFALCVRAVDSLQRVAIFNDGPRFLKTAAHMLDGDFASAWADDYHPLTSLALAGMHLVTGLELDAAARAVSILAGGFGTAAIFVLARDLFGLRCGVTAALLFAVHPRLVAISSNVQSDGLFVALVVVGAVGIWRALATGRSGVALGAGVATGLAYLTRPEGLVLGVLAGVWLIADLWTRKLELRRVLALGAAFALGALLIASPYLVVMRSEEGSFTVSRKKSVSKLLLLEGPAPGHSQGSELDYGLVLSRIADSLRECSYDGYRAFLPVFLVLGLVGVVSSRRERGVRYLASYIGLVALMLFLVHCQTGYISRRHWMSCVALGMPLAALGLLQLSNALRTRLPRRLRLAASLAPVGLLTLASLGVVVASAPPPWKGARMEAARWLAQHETPVVVASPRSREAFATGAERFVHIPDSPDAQATIYRLREQGAEYAVVEDRRLATQDVASLSGVEVMHSISYGDGVVLVLRLSD
jgi:4-amino-4-deoxy-L-arabinose transferase-like glycosyltransferase